MTGPSPTNDSAPKHRPVGSTELLATIYRSPGPYVTVYLAIPALDDDGGDIAQRWRRLRKDLEADEVPAPALEAIDARLALPAPDDSAAVAVIAAVDGTTVVQHGTEPPRADLAVFDTLPYAAPLLEWQQRRVSHLVVVADQTGADVVSFRNDHLTTVDSYPQSGQELAQTVARHIQVIDAELVLVSAVGEANLDLAERIRGAAPISCHVVDERSEPGAVDLADATVREVSDLVARRTVGRLRELRFLTSHDGAVDGTNETIAALADGSAASLLLHDDPRDDRRLWIGSDPRQLSFDEQPEHVQARLVDAAIRSAVLQHIPVNIIPSTGPSGPEDDTAAVLKTTGDPLPD